MAADFEPVANALLDAVKDTGGAVFSSRYRMGLEALPDQPAIIVGLNGVSVQSQHGLPSRWTAAFSVGYIARADGTEVAESRVNEWLVELQDALSAQVNLGGTCEHAWISGQVDIEPPTRENPWMECWVSVEVLVIA